MNARDAFTILGPLSDYELSRVAGDATLGERATAAQWALAYGEAWRAECALRAQVVIAMRREPIARREWR